MKKIVPVLLAIFGICATTLAQNAPSAAGESKPKPATESPGILQRLFGSRQGQRVLFPTPAPQATPAAKTASQGTKPRPKKRKPKPAPDATESAPAPAKTEPPAPAPDAAAPDQSATPAPAPVVPDAPAPAAATPAKKGRKGKAAPVAAAPKTVEPVGDADAEAKEKLRFDQAKAKAAEDPEVMELKAKADSAVSDEDAKTAQRAYNKALFNQMRKIDGTLEEHINAMEAAILKRLDEK